MLLGGSLRDVSFLVEGSPLGSLLWLSVLLGEGVDFPYLGNEGVVEVDGVVIWS